MKSQPHENDIPINFAKEFTKEPPSDSFGQFIIGPEAQICGFSYDAQNLIQVDI